MKRFLAGVLCLTLGFSAVWAQEWKIQDNPILTPWTEEVSPENPLPEYPRPQFVRGEWKSLNGLWDYAIVAEKSAPSEAKPDGKILVPFPVESALSGVKKSVGKDNLLLYERSFEIPQSWAGKRIQLNIEACDWQTTVFVNGKQLGTHSGGFAPFSFDITDALNPTGVQEIRILVFDPTNDSWQPRGKQVNRPGGIYYTPVTGIWESVWLEPTPQEGKLISAAGYAATLTEGKLVPTTDGSFVLKGLSDAGDAASVEANVFDKSGKNVYSACAKVKDGQFVLTGKMEAPELWTPENPYLYKVVYTLNKEGKTIDSVESYMGLRTSTIAKDENGVLRLMLNGKFVFQYGPLDQGWFPDGLYTAPTDEALKYDLVMTKKMGFNMLRKHVKVESRRFYHHCDTLGLLVWQDMPSGDKGIYGQDPDINKCEPGVRNYYAEWTEIINTLQNSPSIVMWVPFNEGWGQFDTEKVVQYTKNLDTTRLVNCASGWTFRNCGDVHDIHMYPGPGRPASNDKFAIVLGEFGGLGLPVKGHAWKEQGNWGYINLGDSQQLLAKYRSMMERLRLLIDEGLSAAVYTQTTDVETESNGLMTYDRKVDKMGAENVAAANAILFKPIPKVHTILPHSQQSPKVWKYVTDKPADGWSNADFDDSAWKQGEAGFGTQSVPNVQPRTEWKTPEIWLRRTFEFDGKVNGELGASIYHDEDAEVYINGVKVLETTGYVTAYTVIPFNADSLNVLKKGQNVIAVHVKQTTGGQFIDLGLVEMVQEE